jgi:hypothetical protein
VGAHLHSIHSQRFCNKEFVRDIRKATLLVVHTNAGTFTVREKAKLPWCDMDIWYDPTAITNVLHFAIMQEKFPIVYDNSMVDAFIVKTPSGDLRFKLLSKTCSSQETVEVSQV